MELGKFEEAEKQYQIVENVVSNPKPEECLDLWRYSQHLFHSYGELWLSRNDFEKANDYANKCLAIAEPGKSSKYIVKARRLRGQVFLKKGEIESAENEIKAALKLAKKVGNPPQLWKTYVINGDLMKICNKPDLAKAAYLKAMQTIENVAKELSNTNLRKTLLNSIYVKSISENLKNLE
jgi:tetratricopeptide (TPR) repeat protein